MRIIRLNFYILFYFLGFIQTLSAQSTAMANKIETPPIIDGTIIGEAVWESIEPISGFWQTMPDEGQAASEKTEIRIAYTRNAIYFGVVCYDREPQKIIEMHLLPRQMVSKLSWIHISIGKMHSSLEQIR